MCAAPLDDPSRLSPLDISSSAGTSAPKSVYPVGEMPPLGYVPEKMHAWAIRRERHGPPKTAMVDEIVDTPIIGEHDVLVLVMAAGVNYNGVWAAMGEPLSPFDIHNAEYHIAGSDASGIVWAVGSHVRHWKVGDEVVIHCNQDDGDDVECNGGDPMLSPTQRIWGYETPDGAFAQFCCVQARQLMHRPQHLSWEESACYTLTLATAYRMMFGHVPHRLQPSQYVLVWGAAGGLGSFAVQLAAAVGAKPIGVVSGKDKFDYVKRMGAVGVIDRNDFDCWGALPDLKDRQGYADYMKRARQFGRAIWEFTGKGNDVDMVFEHPGEATFPISCMVARPGGMIVFCAGTTGYNLTFDARYVWMRQKRIQGSHFATLKQATQANQLMIDQKLDPCLSEVFAWKELADAHTQMANNEHKPGNMAVLVQAVRPGLGAALRGTA